MTKARDLANIISGGFTADDIPNIDASKITSGSIADARIPASAVSQHATSFDDNKIVNDLSTLALRQATSENAIAYNTNSSFIDVFQDATGIDITTNVARNASEYVSSVASGSYADGATTFVDSSSYNRTLTRNGTITHSTLQAKFGTSSIYFGADPTSSPRYVSSADSDSYTLGTGNWTIEFWTYGSQSGGNINSDHHPLVAWNTDVYVPFQIATRPNSNLRWWSSSDSANWNIASDLSCGTIDNSWRHIAIVREGNTISAYNNGSRTSTVSFSGSMANPSNGLTIGRFQGSDVYPRGFIDNIRLSNVARYTASSSSLTMPTTEFNSDANTLYLLKSQPLTVGSTGNFTGTTITAPSSVSSMGAIITYQDQSGTNALNTDIVLELSADNGSNWSTATLSALPNFSTGIKMAKVNDLAVTAGTQLKYRLNFANQANGSKEARIRGVSLQY